MGTITQGGFTKVALLAEQPAGAPPAAKPAPPRRRAGQARPGRRAASAGRG